MYVSTTSSSHNRNIINYLGLIYNFKTRLFYFIVISKKYRMTGINRRGNDWIRMTILMYFKTTYISLFNPQKKTKIKYMIKTPTFFVTNLFGLI